MLVRRKGHIMHDSPPLETVHNLLGVVRLHYALQKRKGNHAYAERLLEAGQQLGRALVFAIPEGDAAAHAEAWRLVTNAIRTIAPALDIGADDLAVAVRPAPERVRMRRFGSDEREARRQARIRRG
jgi:hypothetical protein